MAACFLLGIDNPDVTIPEECLTDPEVPEECLVLGIDNPDVTIPEKECLMDREVPEECVVLPAEVMNNTRRSYRDVLLNS
jgi:hypothetical protein